MEKPILFSAPMVKAILKGRKTMTRRVLKKQPPFLARIRHGWFSAPIYGFTDEDCPAANWWKIRCPYGQPGDQLWVRETWMQPEHDPGKYRYKATNPSYIGRWKPSIHMPRVASRITLEVADVRVERLQEISETDAGAEGLQDWYPDPKKPNAAPYFTNKARFTDLWESINGKKHPWDSNPWVWVVEFKRV